MELFIGLGLAGLLVLISSGTWAISLISSSRKKSKRILEKAVLFLEWAKDGLWDDRDKIVFVEYQEAMSQSKNISYDIIWLAYRVGESLENARRAESDSTLGTQLTRYATAQGERMRVETLYTFLDNCDKRFNLTDIPAIYHGMLRLARAEALARLGVSYAEMVTHFRVETIILLKKTFKALRLSPDNTGNRELFEWFYRTYIADEERVKRFTDLGADIRLPGDWPTIVCSYHNLPLLSMLNEPNDVTLEEVRAIAQIGIVSRKPTTVSRALSYYCARGLDGREDAELFDKLLRIFEGS